MNLPTTKHEDKRRLLVEFVRDIPMKSLKVIHIKERTPVGNHYHLQKDEIFYLVSGKGSYVFTNKELRTQTRDWMFEGDCIFVPRGTIHTFQFFPGSVLIEAATEPYDPLDEIRA